MEMEGRGFSDLLRNTSEEIFLRTMMENPIGITAPSMEMLGFKNITQSFRGDSEELFNSWLANGERDYCSSVAGHRTRQVSRRISTDFVPSQQNGVSFQKKNGDEHTYDPGQCSLRNAADKEMQANNLYLAKAWFCSKQPMTRSRSSELRKRYAAKRSSQMENNMPGHSASKMKQEFAYANNFCDTPVGEISNQMHSFMSPSNSSTTFNAPPVVTADAVSSVVSMLKGTLERKKLNCKAEKEMMEGSCYDMLSSQEAVTNRSCNQAPGSQVTGQPASFHMTSPLQVAGPSNITTVGKPFELKMEGFTTQASQPPASQENSQSESSTAAPALSTGIEDCDGPGHSVQTIYYVSSSRHFGNGTSDHELKANEYKERLFDNSFKDARKKANPVLIGSITLAASVDKADPTKKRRVERSRKMAEAKERNSTPPLPTDMQAVVKRCQTLEKEVRSLKLNLSFMNRKDSEQTKQIEELQKQNDELIIERERLVEEIERIIPDSGKT